MIKIGSYISIFIFWVISLLPLPVLYLFSDFLFHIMRMIGYRRDVINENLTYSFPHKTKEEIRTIRIKFYKHFCDLLIEIVKLQTISQKEMTKRVTFKNLEYFEDKYNNDQDVLAILGHYGNWEWATAFNLHTKALLCSVYRPLKNKVFDSYMLKLRSRWGNTNSPMKKTLKDVIKMRKANQRFVLGLIADQSPGKFEPQYWTKFLNQNTPIIIGPEKLAKTTKSPVVFCRMDKIKRGHYQITFIPVTDDISKESEYSTTEKHVRLLEEAIVQYPEYWLWSHRRWKYSSERN